MTPRTTTNGSLGPPSSPQGSIDRNGPRHRVSGVPRCGTLLSRTHDWWDKGQLRLPQVPRTPCSRDASTVCASSVERDPGFGSRGPGRCFRTCCAVRCCALRCAVGTRLRCGQLQRKHLGGTHLQATAAWRIALPRRGARTM